MKVAVIDYGVGNLGSVAGALELLKAQPVMLADPAGLAGFDSMILPGVGNFTECMRRLEEAGWPQAIRGAVGAGKRLLGVCLGMQLLAETGCEGAIATEGTAGLGLLPGAVQSLASLGCTQRIPHVGWNSVRAVQPCPLLEGVADGSDFYFVHSYAFVPGEGASVLHAACDYEVAVPAIVGRGTVWGTQFHPEKSSRAGSRVLRNFLALAC
jgi:imidazole glycerol-phosphate synthase subunit HisH